MGTGGKFGGLTFLFQGKAERVRFCKKKRRPSRCCALVLAVQLSLLLLNVVWTLEHGRSIKEAKYSKAKQQTEK